MPAILLRFLPHTIALAAILGALWWIDHRAYQRARDDAAFERLVTAHMITRAAREVEQRQADAMSKLATDYHGAAQIIERNRTIIQPTIMREIASVPRLSDPAAGITDLLFEQINRIRRASGTCSPTAGGGIVCALPEPVDAGGQDDRRTDPGGP